MINIALFVANIQNKLPYAKLFLQKKPGPLFDWQSCALTASSMGNPSKTFTMTIAPPDDVEKSFVDNALRVLKG